MQNNRKDLRSSLIVVTLAVICWTSIPFIGMPTAGAKAQCPNAPLAADLTGTATGGVTPGGTARYREKGGNKLIITIRSVNVAADTKLDVYIGETKVGSITINRGRSGQLSVDSPTANIDEGTTISLRSGTGVVLSGTFACVAGGPNTSPTISPTESPSVTPSVSPTTMPSVSPTVSPTTSPTMTPD